jgi:tetratricopeptide (TPR) repeat protein
VAAQASSQAVAAETQTSCPALAPFYTGAYFRSEGDSSPRNNAAVAASPEGQQQWQRLVSELVPLQSRCLRSSEYYALLGAAQLNAGALDLAAEALERALLLDAGNGAAQIDYAEVLLRQGQLFPALQLNAVLEAREDLPKELRQSVVQRGTQWRGLTKQNSVQLDASGGYDSNLNGAPDSGQLTLTLSGEPVVLNLTEDFQPVEGAFSNLRASTRAVTLTEAGRRSWDHEVRARVSEDRQSDLLQFSSQFSQATATRRRSVLFEAGASSIFFGGSSLYTATQARLRVQSNTSKRCAPVYDLASQYQRFHAQPALDAWESRATVGLNCLTGRSTAADVVQRYGIDASYIVSKALSANRPGDDRDGFQLSARYQRPLLRGELLAQATVTHLKDENTYSTLLAGGDERWQRRNQVLIQHRTPFDLGSKSALFTVGLFYQTQASNIALFDMDDASFELGITIPL